MNDNDLLKRLGRELRDDETRSPSAAETELEGSLDRAFEERLFEKLGVPETKAAPTQNLIPFPPNRARKIGTVAAGFGVVFAAAAAFILVQRTPVASLGGYELTASGERFERGADEPSAATVYASTGRPLTLVLRPTAAVTGACDVHVFATLGGVRSTWPGLVESAASGALRVVVTPQQAGTGELTVIVVAKGASVEREPRVVLTKPLEVRAHP